MTNNLPHPDFDGHLEKLLKDMTPEEKLDYIWEQMQLRKYIQTKIIKKEKKVQNQTKD